MNRILAAFFAATLAIGAGCSSEDSMSPAGTGGENASEKRTLTLYSGRKEELVGDLLKDFTKSTGINVEFRGGDSGELAAQLITEGDASPADLFFSQDAGALGALSEAGLLAELSEESLGVVSPEFRSPEGEWVGTSGRARVLMYDPKQVSELPEGIDGLLDPSWKGKLAFAPSNASWQSFVTALRVLRGDEGARTWLEGFAALNPKAYESNDAIAIAVNKGEIAAGFVNHYYLYELTEELGADAINAKLHFFTGEDPGALINVAGVGILNTSDDAEAAQQLIDFLLSETGQSYFAEQTFEYPLRAGVALGADDLPALADIEHPEIDLSDLDSIAETQALLESVGLLTL